MVVLGIDAVNACADYGNRRRGFKRWCCQSALVRSSINTQRQARHHAHALACECLRKSMGIGAALRRRIAAANNCQGLIWPSLEQTVCAKPLLMSQHVQQNRRVGGFQQAAWVVWVAQGGDVTP
ncbi:hypothetical protein D3C72_1776000 [compost metagenome]